MKKKIFNLIKTALVCTLFVLILLFSTCSIIGSSIKNEYINEDKKNNETITLTLGDKKVLNDELQITFDVFEDNHKLNYQEENKRYIIAKVIVKNVSDKKINLSNTVNCYCDEQRCNEYFFTDIDGFRELSGELDAKKETVGYCCFEVPMKSNKWEIKFDFMFNGNIVLKHETIKVEKKNYK